MTTDKLSYTLTAVWVLVAIMLHVHDAPLIYASHHVITYSLKQSIPSLATLQNKQQWSSSITP